MPGLIGAGYLVRGQYLTAPGNVPGVDWRRWDFLESLEVDPLVDGCDAVIHLAAELCDIGKMERINVDATRALAEAAAACGARYFGHASSIVVYGSPRARRVNEQTPLIDLARPVAKPMCGSRSARTIGQPEYGTHDRGSKSWLSNAADFPAQAWDEPPRTLQRTPYGCSAGDQDCALAL